MPVINNTSLVPAEYRGIKQRGFENNGENISGNKKSLTETTKSMYQLLFAQMKNMDPTSEESNDFSGTIQNILSINSLSQYEEMQEEVKQINRNLTSPKSRITPNIGENVKYEDNNKAFLGKDVEYNFNLNLKDKNISEKDHIYYSIEIRDENKKLVYLDKDLITKNNKEDQIYAWHGKDNEGNETIKNKNYKFFVTAYTKSCKDGVENINYIDAQTSHAAKVVSIKKGINNDINYLLTNNKLVSEDQIIEKY